MKPIFKAVLLLTLLLTACTGLPAPERPQNPPGGAQGARGGDNQGVQGGGKQGGNGGGMMGGNAGGMMGGDHGFMHKYHMVQIPAEYARVVNTVPADEASIARGEEVYVQNCTACHGDGGMGDGPAGVALNPPPSPIAMTSVRLGDNYLFWRISEGGINDQAPSAMPAWKEALDETARWDVINYLRALGSGRAQPRQSVGGATFDPQLEAAQRAEMLAQATEQRVITQTEADTFESVHAALDDYMLAQGGGFIGRMEEIQAEALAELVTSGVITQSQADMFLDVHERLLQAGLMQ